MENTTRHSLYSKFCIRNLKQVEEKELKNIISITRFEDLPDYVIIEYVSDADWENFINEGAFASSAESDDLGADLTEEYLQTTLNKDPFGAKHSGETLSQIFESDPAWCIKASKELKNQFIRDRINYLLERGYGKN